MSAVVPLEGRGALLRCPLHGEPVYLHAVRVAAERFPGVTVSTSADDVEQVADDVGRAGLPAVVTTTTQWWVGVREQAASAPLLVHDPLCPLAPADLLTRLFADAGERPGRSLATFRPVTDTVKTVDAGAISGTVDRATLAALTSPVVIAAATLAAAAADDDLPPLADVRLLVGWLRGRGPLDLVPGPGIGRRVDDASGVMLLECIDEVARRVHR